MKPDYVYSYNYEYNYDDYIDAILNGHDHKSAIEQVKREYNRITNVQRGKKCKVH